jgi:hypothetical protein
VQPRSSPSSADCTGLLLRNTGRGVRDWGKLGRAGPLNREAVKGFQLWSLLWVSLAGDSESAQFASLARTGFTGKSLPRASSPFNLDLGRPSHRRPGSGYPTHAVAQMRRTVAQRGLDCEPIEPRAEQRFPEIAPETVLEEVGGTVVARCDRRLAENDRDDLAAITSGARHNVKAGFLWLRPWISERPPTPRRCWQ